VRALLNPRLVIPTSLGLALIGTLVGVSDAGKIASTMQHLRPGFAVAFVVLMVIYEAIRGLQWHVLLEGLDVRVPLDAQAFSFLLGEATRTAPIGNYFQNYLLSRVEGEDFGRTAAATTLIVLTEVGWGLLAIVVIGVDGWTWLRPLILIGLAAFLCVIVLVYHLERQVSLPRWITRHALARTLLDELSRFRRGIAALVRPRPLTIEAALSAAYLSTAGAGLYVLAVGIGVDQLSFWQMLGIYAFSLTAGLIVPLPIDLGVVEVGGVGALVASGLNREAAISLMLLNRLLSVGSAIGIAAVGMLFLGDELRRALSRDRAARPCRDRARNAPG
jgi:uncharacterized protein (TIRG00374 family)